MNNEELLTMYIQYLIDRGPRGAAAHVKFLREVEALRGLEGIREFANVIINNFKD